MTVKIYCGIDMAKDKFDYCIADSENILTRGNNCENTTEEFERLIGVLKGFGDRFTPVIGMESTGIYHFPPLLISDFEGIWCENSKRPGSKGNEEVQNKKNF